jgi:hypothetical protein
MSELSRYAKVSNTPEFGAVVALIARTFSPDQPGGVSRLAAFGFFMMALAGAVLVLLSPG